MGIFGKKTPPTQPPRPATRTIPQLDPDFFESIQSRLAANGGSESVDNIAFGVGNAIFNTGSKYLQQTYANKQLKDFVALYDDRVPQDRSAADRMVDFLVTYEPTIQSGEAGWLGTLLGKLDDVLSRPA